MKLLIINPGSTSTKVSLFEDDVSLWEESEFHDAPLLLQYPCVNDQVPFRKQVVLRMLRGHGYEPEQIDIYVGRGGGAYPQPAGVTYIDELLYKDTLAIKGGSEHASNLGVLVAYELCCEYGGQMYTLNPTNVDEYCDYARVTGIKGVYRVAQTHALNQKAIARYHAEHALGRRYDECRFVVAHIDGGVTVNAHDLGRMIDGTEGAGGEGSYSPTRVGSVPVLSLIDYLETHPLSEVRLMCSRAGGFVSHFGTSNSDIIHKMVDEGDPKATLIWNAMIYNVCKAIGGLAPTLSGKCDGILLTGGLMRFPEIEQTIRERCGFIAPVTSYPGEMEQEELAGAVMRVMRGEEQAHHYSGKPVWDGFDFDK